MGTMIAYVPQDVPVAKAMNPLSTKARKGTMAGLIHARVRPTT